MWEESTDVGGVGDECVGGGAVPAEKKRVGLHNKAQNRLQKSLQCDKAIPKA